MIRNYKITYRAVLRQKEITIQALSKYDAKRRFYQMYPKYEIIKVEEVAE